MKRLLSLLLVFTLALSVVMTVGCDSSGNNDPRSETDNGNPGDGENTGAQGDNGNNFGYEKSETEKKLAELAAKGGYEIKSDYDLGDGNKQEYVFGAKDDASWYIYGGEGHAFLRTSEHQVAMYSYENGAWVFNSNLIGDNSEDITAAYTAIFTVNMFWANSYSDELEPAGTTVKCGRKCRTYKYDYSFMSTGSYYTVNVDEETGLTMEYQLTVKAEGQTAAAHYEVTSFKTGISMPDLPAPGEDYADYTGELGWPTNSFTEKLPAVNFGTVKLSGISGSAFSAMISGATADNFDTYVAALMDAGFAGERMDMEGLKMFQGTNADNCEVTVNLSEGNLTISLQKAD